VGELTIRQATAEDIPPMVAMGLRFLKNSPYVKHLAENAEQMAKLGESLLASAGGMLVAEAYGQIVGMLGYIVYDHFISGEKTAGEVFWWVEPEHRGAGLKLLYELERIAHRSRREEAADDRAG
jgi:RimJ/RimL family protein N-acetyltransferase